MKIRLGDLRRIIKEELSHGLNEMAATATLKRILKLNKALMPRDVMTLQEAKAEIDEILDSKELLMVAQQVRKMVDKQTPSTVIVKYVDSVLTGTVREALEVALAIASPEQLKELEFEASFGGVDVMSSALEKQLIKDPLDALDKLKAATSGGQSVSDIWLVSIQLRTMHDILEDVSRRMSEMIPGAVPREEPLW